MKFLSASLLTLLISSAAVAKDDNHQEHEWGYMGAKAAHSWWKLKDEYKLCGIGKMQSPINVIPNLSAKLPEIRLDYNPTRIDLLNNGHTIQLNYEKGSHFMAGDKKYKLLQLHFHSPSENQINGKTYPMELHLVHKDTEDNLAVIAVMIESSKRSHASIEALWKHLPKQSGSNNVMRDLGVNAKHLLPKKHEYYRFMGSLTTPPCSEGVNWYVMKDPIQLSKRQIAAFSTLFPYNARYVQPRNGRLVIN